jgi:hypothetical protein
MDRVLEILADGGRRTVIQALSENGSATVEELARRIEPEHGLVRQAEVALVHRHLPAPRATGVISYDPEDRHVELDEAGDVLSVLGSVSERLE